MPFLGAAVVPHSPLLLPTLAKDHAPLGAAARESFQVLRAHMTQAGLTTVVILTPHGLRAKNALVMAGGEYLAGALKDFGELERSSFPISSVVTQSLYAIAQDEGLPIMIQHIEEADYGLLVPLRLLMLPTDVRVVGVSVFGAPTDTLIRLGRAIQEAAHRSAERIALIASCDLSRRRGEHDRSDRPTPIERQIARSLQARSLHELPALSSHSFCGLAPLIAMLSAIEGSPGMAEIISVGAPYGVGYITAWMPQ